MCPGEQRQNDHGPETWVLKAGPIPSNPGDHSAGHPFPTLGPVQMVKDIGD